MVQYQRTILKLQRLKLNLKFCFFILEGQRQTCFQKNREILGTDFLRHVHLTLIFQTLGMISVYKVDFQHAALQELDKCTIYIKNDLQYHSILTQVICFTKIKQEKLSFSSFKANLFYYIWTFRFGFSDMVCFISKKQLWQYIF